MDDQQKTECLQAFEGLCWRHGLPVTVQRRMVYEVLLVRGDHPTAEEILGEVQARLPEVSRTTVYRVLERLVAIGAVMKVSAPGAATRYDALKRRHHHLICRRCDRIIDLEDPRLDEAVRIESLNLSLFEIDDFSVYLYGICDDCRARVGAHTT